MKRVTCFSPLLCALVLLSGCDDGDPGDAVASEGPGTAGESGAGAAGDGGTGGGSGSAGSAGAGGTTAGSSGEGGAAGSGGAGATAGAGGTGGIVEPQPSMIFSVEPFTNGVTGSALGDQANGEASLFTSETQDFVSKLGTNQIAVTPADLGLLATDDIDAVSVLKPIPQSPIYYFSVAERGDTSNEEGERLTALRRESVALEVSGDVFFSDASGTGEMLSDTGDIAYGYNALYVDEHSIGIEPAQVPGMNALELDVMPGDKIYFSVAPNAEGVAGSGVANTLAVERGCAIYESSRDGTNTQIFSCADLGLTPSDNVDALVALGGDPSGAPEEVIFSVSTRFTPLGLGPRGVEPTIAPGGIYRSKGDKTTPEALALPFAIGLVENNLDDLNALAIRDRAITDPYPTPSTCQLTPAPIAEIGAAYGYVQGALPLRDGVATLLVESDTGLDEGPQMHLLGYDLKTCELKGQPLLVDAGIYQRDPGAFALGPAWSPADPLANIEYWVVDVAQGILTVQRMDPETAAIVESYFASPPGIVDGLITQIVANPTTARAFSVVHGTSDARSVFEFVLPTGGTEASPLEFQTVGVAMPWPCNRSQYFVDMAVEPSGDGLEVVAFMDWNEEQRVCSLTHDMHIKDLVRPWSPPPFQSEGVGSLIVAPGTGIFRIDPDSVAGEVVVERFFP